MAVNFKKIENISLINPGDHAVLFYEEKEEHLAAVYSFIKMSLKNNEKCIYVDLKANQDKILAELKRTIGNVDTFLETGQLQLFAAEELYGDPENFSADDMISLLEEKVKLAVKEGYTALSITGELKEIIDFKGGKEEIIKYEWKLHDQIFEKYPVKALCRYNINRFDNEIIKAAVELHDYIVWQGKLNENPYYIDPEGYKRNKVEKYEIKSWLKNIRQYQKKEELSAYNQQLQAYYEEVTAMNEEIEESFQEIEELNNRFQKMISLVSDIENLNTISEAEFLSKILKQAVEIVPEADFGSVYTFDDQYVNFIDCIGYDLESLKKRKIPNQAFYNQNSPIDIVDIEEIKRRNKKHMSSDEFEKISDLSLNKHKEVMYFTLIINGVKKAGVSLDIKSENSKNFTNSSKKIFSAFYNIASSFFKMKEYNFLQNNFTKELISSTTKMLEMYDLYTRGHSENVAELAAEIAAEMELEQKRIDDIYWAGLVHDIGKILIPLEILNKQGKLSDSEYQVIKEHPVLGSNSLKSSKSLQHIAKYVRHHHEDGMVVVILMV